MTWAADYPWGVRPDVIEKFLGRVEADWGTGTGLTALWPSRASDAELREWWARYQRLSASPGAAVRLLQMSYETDCRPVLGSITCPTLVVHRAGDRFVSCEQGRHLAERIPAARYVELQGADHVPWGGEADVLLEEIEEFLTGVRHGAEPDRVLATVLFTDIVGSTERAAALGDRRWRDLLDAYYGAARRQLVRFRGRELDTAGDGFFAAFDGPARAIRCGCAIRDAVRPLGLQVRAGLHTGECEALGDKLSGIAVHIGARVAAHAEAGEVIVSGTVKDLVAGSGLRFEDRGVHSLRGVPGEWRLFAVSPESTA
jgi:class 3 adenylate cyclase